MDFELSEDHRLLQSSVRDFAEKEIRPLAAQIDETHRIPPELIGKMSEMGLLGIFLPEAYGGAGMDILSYAIVIEEVSRACASCGILISAHSSLACDLILHFGTEEQKQRFLPSLATGAKIGCLLLTEPQAGSDVSGIATTCRKEGDEYILHGSKIFVTNGGFRGTGIVCATLDRSQRHAGLTAFILDLESPGVEILKHEQKLGIRGTYTTAFALDHVRVPASNLLGAEGQGFRIAMEGLNGGRIGVASQALGIASGAFERARTYARERKQFGKPIGELQAIQFKLADMFTRIETSRLLTYRAAWLKQRRQHFAMESAMCKLHASETAAFVTDEALQIHGGYGYITDYEIERMYRDARITRIYEGTSEIQRLIIAKTLLG
ncbi:MAG: acyl-CoA dehydrogenase family protein [Acidobacteriota bacterium]